MNKKRSVTQVTSHKPATKPTAGGLSAGKKTPRLSDTSVTNLTAKTVKQATDKSSPVSLDPESEKQLIETAQSALPEADAAFNQLISCYQTHVLQYAQSSLGDYDNAMDAVQETFIFAWKNLDKFVYTAPGKFKSWLLAICKNKNYEVRRGRQFEDYVLYALKNEVALGNTHDPYASPRLGKFKNNKDYLRQQEPSGFIARYPTGKQPTRAARKTAAEIERLNEAYTAKITCLPKIQFAVFTMYQEDYTIGEIAHALGISPNAASQNLYKAKKKLRELDKLANLPDETEGGVVNSNSPNDVKR